MDITLMQNFWFVIYTWRHLSLLQSLFILVEWNDNLLDSGIFMLSTNIQQSCPITHNLA